MCECMPPFVQSSVCHIVPCQSIHHLQLFARFVYPPGMLKAGEDRGHPLMNAANWLASGAYVAALKRKHPNGQQVLRECPQRPGELFYLPASWYADRTAQSWVHTSDATGLSVVFGCSCLELLDVSVLMKQGAPDAQFRRFDWRRSTGCLHVTPRG